MDRAERDRWASCASLWGRLFVLAVPFWERAPHVRGNVEKALLAVLGGRTELYNSLVGRLEGFDVEDDGSPEWGYAVDLMSSLLDALQGEDAASCLSRGASSYLDSTFNELALQLAEAKGQPVVSQADAEVLVSTEPSWQRANECVQALLP